MNKSRQPSLPPRSRPWYAADEGHTARPAPGRPKAVAASRKTRLALGPSRPAQAGLEPRPSFPSGDRPRYAADEGHT